MNAISSEDGNDTICRVFVKPHPKEDPENIRVATSGNLDLEVCFEDDLIKLRVSKGLDKLKPGLTGWAQVNGRDDLSIQLKVDYEVEYMEKKSFSFDLYIIWLTLLKIIKKDGVSH